MRILNVREQTEEFERQTLSQYAQRAAQTRGRTRPEEPCDIRTAYQRDRDRILHCNSFKRLKNKTQVFLSPNRDHYRTRLIHTLEVAQIARTAARGLRLNEDLTEAIALGHDLGHTPFGHAGERVLDDICPHRFKHAANSVRNVEFLEKDGRGLNLTYEVKNGIACHTDGVAATLEGRLVRMCDKIAYVNHDIEDAVRAGILEEKELPYNCVYILGRTKSERITTLLTSIIQNSAEDISCDPMIYDAHLELRQFMFDYVYSDPVAKAEEGKAEEIVRRMYQYYKEHPRKMPEFYQSIAEQEDMDRAVCDYIAGMSDNYIVDTYCNLFIPKSWE